MGRWEALEGAERTPWAEEVLCDGCVLRRTVTWYEVSESLYVTQYRFVATQELFAMFLLAAGQQSGFLGTNAGPSQLGNPTAAGAAKMFSDYRGILSGESWVSAPTMKTSAKPVFVTYSFPKTMTDGDRITFSDSIESWKPFSSRDIVDAREALKQWGDASGITFLETKGDHGDIQFSWLPRIAHHVGLRLLPL